MIVVSQNSTIWAVAVVNRVIVTLLVVLTMNLTVIVLLASVAVNSMSRANSVPSVVWLQWALKIVRVSHVNQLGVLEKSKHFQIFRVCSVA